MPKLKIPLLSFRAVGQLSKNFVLRRRGKATILERKPIPTDAKSPNQLIWRTMYQACTALWHNLSNAEKAQWESLARPRHMTGYAWYISQCLRPNPGIYLPLAGGTMAGDIEMDSNRILDLIDPTVDQEAATKKYHDDNLPAGAYKKGARVYHNAAQSIPDTSYTALAFNQEDFDTDTIHSPTVNNSRLTCKTPGKYGIVGSGYWAANATGTRRIGIIVNNTTFQNLDYKINLSNDATFIDVSAILNLALNDYIELQAYQTSGGPLNIGGASIRHLNFAMQRVG